MCGGVGGECDGEDYVIVIDCGGTESPKEYIRVLPVKPSLLRTWGTTIISR